MYVLTGINAPPKEEAVPFEAGKKRGKVFVPKYNEAELAAIARKNEIAEAVRLDDDEETALGGATVDDLMSLAEILDSNPQVVFQIVGTVPQLKSIIIEMTHSIEQ